MRSALVVVFCLGLAACAGRAAQPVAVVQAQDSHADCTAINAEIAANNATMERLSEEQGWKIAQNVAAGVAGLVIWPLWFGMDFQGSASTEAMALANRQKYLATLASQRCAR